MMEVDCCVYTEDEEILTVHEDAELQEDDDDDQNDEANDVPLYSPLTVAAAKFLVRVKESNDISQASVNIFYLQI